MFEARPLHDRTMRQADRWACGVLVAMALSSTTTRAGAQPNRTFELTWQAPANCPQQLEVTEKIRVMLGAAPGLTLPSGLRSRGLVEIVDARYRLTLSVRVGETERSRVIAADNCSSLGKAAAVILSLLIRKENESGRELSDSDLGGDFTHPTEPDDASKGENRGQTNQSDGTTKPSEPAQPAKPEESVTAPSPRPDPSHRRPWQLLLMAPTATVDYFTMPHVGVGVGIAAGVTSGGWRGFVTGTLWQTQQVTPGGVEAYKASFARKSLEGWGCRGWRSGDWEVSPCALVAMDVVSASASGDRLITKAHTLVLASAGAGLAGFWHLTEGLGLFLTATGRVALRRSEFVVEGMLRPDQTHTVPWATFVTSIGSEWFF